MCRSSLGVAEVSIGNSEGPCILFYLALVSGSTIGIAPLIDADIASAADDCVTESNLVPPKGSRWYYRVDPATDRKCWYIAALPPEPVAGRTLRTSAKSERAQTGEKHPAQRVPASCVIFLILTPEAKCGEQRRHRAIAAVGPVHNVHMSSLPLSIVNEDFGHRQPPADSAD
jgi:hypothetical protein